MSNNILQDRIDELLNQSLEELENEPILYVPLIPKGRYFRIIKKPKFKFEYPYRSPVIKSYVFNPIKNSKNETVVRTVREYIKYKKLLNI